MPVGYPGLIRSPFFHLNFYTSPALLSMAVYILISILMIYKFTEYVVLDNKNINLNDIYESNAISINHGLYIRLLSTKVRYLTNGFCFI